jgi:hypothetical protein
MKRRKVEHWSPRDRFITSGAEASCVALVAVTAALAVGRVTSSNLAGEITFTGLFALYFVWIGIRALRD